MADLAGDHHLDLLALCSLTAGEDRCDWGVIARQAHREGSLEGLLSGKMLEGTKRAHDTGWIASTATDDQWETAYARARTELVASEAIGAGMTSVLDGDYPLNLRFIHNLPPFIFYIGNLDEDADARSVAVVGTREASEEGLEAAWRISSELASQGITVTSGLARGIDAAAHNAALDAGGRTISVFGTGITKVSPVGHRELAERIVDEGGLLVSQFFPTLPGAKWTFSKRNEVTSGISQATIVIEASRKSGARKQARLAYEHGKRVFLIQPLVESEEWANSMVEQRKATPISTVAEVVSSLAYPDDLRSADKSLHKESLLF